ncbi:DNA repair protein RadC [Vibrio sp.]|nr:DNA repair protein RadC [Vibrio sp.]
MHSSKHPSIYPLPTHARSLTELNQILETAAEALAEKYQRSGLFTQPDSVKSYLKFKLGSYDREVFAVMLLDSQNQLIQYQELFWGTINAASVYPREVVKAALMVNAASIIFSHNHPSGSSTPSQADRDITTKLTEALNLIDIKVLDHIVVGTTVTSFAEKGWI